MKIKVPKALKKTLIKLLVFSSKNMLSYLI